MDIIEKIGDSLIQHGKFNDRIYLMKFFDKDLNKIILKFDELILKYKYSKIFIKIPSNFENFFWDIGFKKEAFIPKFYGNDDCIFMAKYFSENRKFILKNIKQKIENVLDSAKLKKNENINFESFSFDKYKIKILNESDIKSLTLLYKRVFATYPFPIFDEKYILKTMKDNVIYFGCFINDSLVATSSAEIDFFTKSVEMTDFATDVKFRGKGIAVLLLNEMEKEMKNRNINIFYTIARSVSFGMNITFSKLNYDFGGTLINNTNISGNIENMNVWYKKIV